MQFKTTLIKAELNTHCHNGERKRRSNQNQKSMEDYQEFTISCYCDHSNYCLHTSNSFLLYICKYILYIMHSSHMACVF